MAIIERKILITDKDANGNITYDFPITKADNVEGLAEVAKTGKYSDLKNVPTLQTDPLKVGGIKIDQPISSGTAANGKSPYIYFLRNSASDSSTYNVAITNGLDNGLIISGKDRVTKIKLIESPKDAKKNSSIPVITSVHGYWQNSNSDPDHGFREEQSIIKTNEYYNASNNTYTVGSELHGNTEIKLTVGSNVTKLDNSGNLIVSKNIRANNFYPVGSIYLSTVKKTTDQLSDMFGGTWVQIGGGYALVAADDKTYKSLQTGGSKTHTLTPAEMPKHVHDKGSYRIVGKIDCRQSVDNEVFTNADTHTSFTGALKLDDYVNDRGGAGWDGGAGYQSVVFDTNLDGKKGWSGTSGTAGGTNDLKLGQASPFSLMQPYISVYMYYRKS